MTSLEQDIIRKYYAEIIEAVNKSEKEYNNNKRSKKKQNLFLNFVQLKKWQLVNYAGF